jgi:NagD protein
MKRMDMQDLRAKRGYICDMDGVIYHGNRVLPGAQLLCNGFMTKARVFCF